LPVNFLRMDTQGLEACRGASRGLPSAASCAAAISGKRVALTLEEARELAKRALKFKPQATRQEEGAKAGQCLL